MKEKSHFRRRDEQEGCFLIPNAWDAGTARILASLGYSALATTSAGMAFALVQREGQVSQKTTLTPLPHYGYSHRPAGFGRS